MSFVLSVSLSCPHNCRLDKCGPGFNKLYLKLTQQQIKSNCLKNNVLM